jgi:hypothetical protein
MWKDQAITKETKADHKITDQCKMIQYVVGQISKGNYGAHSDACPLLNANGTELEDDISIGMDAFFLLTINEQTTYTIVLTNSTFPISPKAAKSWESPSNSREIPSTFSGRAVKQTWLKTFYYMAPQGSSVHIPHHYFRKNSVSIHPPEL